MKETKCFHSTGNSHYFFTGIISFNSRVSRQPFLFTKCKIASGIQKSNAAIICNSLGFQTDKSYLMDNCMLLLLYCSTLISIHVLKHVLILVLEYIFLYPYPCSRPCTRTRKYALALQVCNVLGITKKPYKCNHGPKDVPFQLLDKVRK